MHLLTFCFNFTELYVTSCWFMCCFNGLYIFQCLSLEDIGFDSLVIVVARSCQTGIGSQKGKNFLESFDLVEEFSRYCEGKYMYLIQNSKKNNIMLLPMSSRQGTLNRPTQTYAHCLVK